MSATLEHRAASPPKAGAAGDSVVLTDLRELSSLLLSDWLESWRGVFPSHGLKEQWALIGVLSLLAALAMGGIAHQVFHGLHLVLGARMPGVGAWAPPFLMTLAYGWFFLTTIWLARTYRRRDRVIPLLLSPLPFPHLAAYMMLRDTGLVMLLVSLLGYPFLLGALLGVGADLSAIALSAPLWAATMVSALAMANATILILYRVLPAGWEGPLSFAAANVLVLMLPMLTKGLGSVWVPFYWPGAMAAKVMQALPGWPRLQAFSGLVAMTAGFLLMVHALTRHCLHANWSKSEELVPSKLLGRISFLYPGQSAWTTVLLKDWLLIARAWGEAMVLVILMGVVMRLRHNMGLPMLEVTGAPLLGAMLVAWTAVELLAFLGESQREGPATTLLALSPLGTRPLVWAKFVSIAVPRLLLGEAALLAATLQGHLAPHHAGMGQVGLLLMIATLTWLEVPHAFEGDPARLGRWLHMWERFFGFWRLLVVYPFVGLAFVLATQLAALAWDQGVSALTGMCFGGMGIAVCVSAMLCTALVRRKL
ncbi:hypothetical protein D3C72_509560 [compost metagenome]